MAVGKPSSSKRIQFHIDAATALPLPKHSRRAYVTVKITDADAEAAPAKERPHGHLRTSSSASIGDHDAMASWQENLTASTVSENSQVVFEVKQHSIWPLTPKPNRNKLAIAITDPYPLSTLLEMQGGNAFGTNIELPLRSPLPSPRSPGAAPASPVLPAGSLSVNIRELSSRQTADLDCRRAQRLSEERKRSVEENRDAAPSPEIMERPRTPATSTSTPRSP